MPAIKELERFFAHFNRKLYKGKLPQPVITIQTAGRKPYLGWFRADSWKDKKKEVPEINITAEEMNRAPEAILETLIHEMVHLDNWMNNIKDVSSNQYHNKNFLRGCEEVNLICERGNHGWNSTSLSPELRRIIRAGKPRKSAFKTFRVADGGAKTGSGSKLIKWTCGCTNVRVAVPDFDATCNACGNEFSEAE